MSKKEIPDVCLQFFDFIPVLKSHLLLVFSYSMHEQLFIPSLVKMYVTTPVGICKKESSV